MTRSRSALDRVRSDPALLLSLLSVARTGIGAAAFGAPVSGVRLLGADPDAAVSMSWATRTFASRDFAVGLLGIASARRGTQDALGTALLIGAVCDLGDVVTFLLAVRAGQLGPTRGYGLVLASGGAVAAGLLGTVTLRTTRSLGASD